MAVPICDHDRLDVYPLAIEHVASLFSVADRDSLHRLA